MTKILLGYEIGTGLPVEIPLSHLIVTGITNLSGKTTALEALIKRSGMQAVVFKTKIGEKELSDGIETPPFFRNKSDYEFVKSLIEAYSKEKLYLEKGTLMDLCKGSKDLTEIKKKVDERLATGKVRGIKEEILIRLQHYLENLIPQVQNTQLSSELHLTHGKMHIVNLERFSSEAQSLIIEATVTEVLSYFSDTLIVIPEAWKFIPQKYNNPCKRAVEAFIRQGATNHNHLFIDSQDMANVDKTPLKQVSTWILGFQTERNEVKHTLDQISLSKDLKPSVDEIMTLRTGQFYVSSYDFVKKVYVRPSWLDEDSAIKVAKGLMNVEDLKKPESQEPVQIKSIKEEVPISDKTAEIFREMLKEGILSLNTKIREMERRIEELSFNHIDRKKLIGEILSQLPTGNGVVVYQVAPLEKLQKDFLEETRKKLLDDISKLSPEHRRIIAFVESAGKGINQTELVSRCFFLSATSGGSRQKVLNLCKDIEQLQLLRRDKNSTIYPKLKERIKSMLEFHGATEQEVEQVYQHILAGLIIKSEGGK